MTLLTPSGLTPPTENQPVDNQPETVYHQPEVTPLKKRSRSRRWRRWIWIAVVIIILAIVLPVAINGAIIAKKAVGLSQRVEKITSAASTSDWTLIKSELSGSSDDLSTIRKSVGYLGPVLLIPPIGQSAKVSRQMLLTAGDLLDGYSEAMVILEDLQTQTADAGQVIGQIGNKEQKKTLLSAIAANQEALSRARTKIEQAQKDLNDINIRDFNGIFKDRLLDFNQSLSEVVANSEIAMPIFANLPELVGQNQPKTYLFVFQNNMEIRPTGGFIGSYGLLTLKDGEVVELTTDDVYNLDKLSEGKLSVAPPLPMQKFMGQKEWFMRDANWYTDWPTSARNIIWFFDREREYGKLPYQRLDGVIGLTPNFIANLLKVVGPITIDGVTFTDENFAMELEMEVERNYMQRGLPKSERKSIIGPLTQELIARIEKSSLPNMIQAWLAFKKNIDEKQILVYLTNPQTQNYFNDQNWSGMLKSSPSDYLQVVDANMAAWKTDSVMKKSINYRLNDEGNKLIGHLEVTYQHQSERVNYFIREYRDYVQIYVPEGAIPLAGYIIDQAGWHPIDLKTDLEVRNEFGKTVLAYFFSVEPKSTKTLVLEYRLPETTQQLYLQGLYKLIAQKQPGTVGHDLKIDLSFNKYFQAYHSEIMPAKVSGKELQWHSDLRVDREFTVKF